MNTEYEATFLSVDKDEIREKLNSIGAKLIRKEFLQRRYNFDLQNLGLDFWEWVRIRDNGEKIVMTYKSIPADAT